MTKKDFDEKLKILAFESIDCFLEETQLNRKDIELFIKKDNFPNYFNFIFECLTKIKNINDENKKRNNYEALQHELNQLKEENKNLKLTFNNLKKNMVRNDDV